MKTIEQKTDKSELDLRGEDRIYMDQVDNMEGGVVKYLIYLQDFNKNKEK
jgi:hypothetical protein